MAYLLIRSEISYSFPSRLLKPHYNIFNVREKFFADENIIFHLCRITLVNLLDLLGRYTFSMDLLVLVKDEQLSSSSSQEVPTKLLRSTMVFLLKANQ